MLEKCNVRHGRYGKVVSDERALFMTKCCTLVLSDRRFSILHPIQSARSYNIIESRCSQQSGSSDQGKARQPWSGTVQDHARIPARDAIKAGDKDVEVRMSRYGCLALGLS